MSPAVPAPAQQPPAIDQVKLKSALKSFVETRIIAPTDMDQLSLLSNASKMSEYWKGNQHLVLERRGDGQLDWVPVGSSMRLQNQRQNQDQRLYDYHMNIFRGDGTKFVSVIGQRAPNVRAISDRDGDDVLDNRVKLANVLAGVFRVAWNASRMQKQLAFHQWTTGTSFIYTYWNSDAERYGTTSEPVIDFVDRAIGPETGRCMMCGDEGESSLFANGCPTCTSPNVMRKPAPTAPFPVVTHYQSYANGMVDARVCSVREVTLPSNLMDVRDAPWLRFEYEEDQGILADLFPDQLSEKVGREFGSGFSAATEQGAIARDQASRPAASPAPTRFGKWTYSQIWMTPSQYGYITDKVLRAQCKKVYPRGLKMSFVGGDMMRVEGEKLSEHWAHCKPGISEGIHADPIGKDMLPVCDLHNDFLNFNAAAAERLTPLTLADPRVLNFNQFKNRRRLPGDIIPALANPGGDFAKHFYKMPVATIDQALTQYGGILLEQVREVTGILRPIFGGDSGSQTATEAESKRVQALMQLSTPYDEIRACWERAYLNAVKLFASKVAGGVDMPGVRLLPQEAMEMRELADGGFHFEAEEGMPMTWAQKRALTWSVIDKGPQVWDLLGLGTTHNKKILMNAVGFDDWEVPYTEDINKINRTIRELLQAQPIPGPMGLEPSIPADQFEDDHQFVVTFIQQWSQSPTALSERQQNPAGYANVIAWALAHKAQIPPPMPPPDGKASPKASGPPPPPNDLSAPGSALMGPSPDAGLSAPAPDQPEQISSTVQ